MQKFKKLLATLMVVEAIASVGAISASSSNYYDEDNVSIYNIGAVNGTNSAFLWDVNRQGGKATIQNAISTNRVGSVQTIVYISSGANWVVIDSASNSDTTLAQWEEVIVSKYSILTNRTVCSGSLYALPSMSSTSLLASYRKVLTNS
ncbi:hypothetical protein FACS1894132_02910 [Clostridia bacterium]|nr:hypothetical protein FACS1894132_02910 [Clostridia bacterium]